MSSHEGGRPDEVQADTFRDFDFLTKCLLEAYGPLSAQLAQHGEPTNPWPVVTPGVHHGARRAAGQLITSWRQGEASFLYATQDRYLEVNVGKSAACLRLPENPDGTTNVPRAVGKAIANFIGPPPLRRAT